jgi:hypothetical protein
MLFDSEALTGATERILTIPYSRRDRQIPLTRYDAGTTTPSSDTCGRG